MTDLNHRAGPKALTLLTALLMLVGSTASHAETTLQRFLARLDANPALVFGGVYLNYSEVLALDAQAAAIIVGGTVVLTHNAEEISVDQATTPGTGTVTGAATPPSPFPLKIDTNVIGGTNTGLVKIDHTLYLADPLTGGTLPGQSLMALNAASTHAQVLSSVSLLSNVNNPPDAKITTSAIGSSNMGAISIRLKNDGIVQAGGS